MTASILSHPRGVRETPLPEHLNSRLAAEGVYSLEDWRALGRRRLRLFGIPPRLAAELDALARAPQPKTPRLPRHATAGASFPPGGTP